MQSPRLSHCPVCGVSGEGGSRKIHGRLQGHLHGALSEAQDAQCLYTRGGPFRSANSPAPEASPSAGAKGWEGFLEKVTSQLSPDGSAGGAQATKRGRVTGRGAGRGPSGTGPRGARYGPCSQEVTVAGEG